MASAVRRAELPGGRALVVRPVGPEDLEPLQALYEGLDDDARYRRFFSVFRPDRSWFERLVQVRDRGGVGLVAVVTGAGDGPDLVGEASYELLPDGDGELAVTVDRRWRGWLGPYLLDALLDAADAAGVPNLEADVLCSNRAMLSLIRSRAHGVMQTGDWSVARFMVASGEAEAPSWPGQPAGAAPRVLVEGGGGHWRGAEAARARGLQVVGCAGPERRRRPCPLAVDHTCPLVAGADAVVLVRPGDSAAWDTVRGAHQARRPRVPVFVDPAEGATVRSGEASLAGLSADEAAAAVDAACRAAAP